MFYFASMGMPPTILYDYAILGEHGRGGLSPAEQAGHVFVPTLVLAGGSSPKFMLDAATGIADVLPHGRLRVLDGEEHVVAPEVLTPVVGDFLLERRS